MFFLELKNVTLFGNRVVVLWVKMRPYGSREDWSPYEKRGDTQRDTACDDGGRDLPDNVRK